MFSSRCGAPALALTTAMILGPGGNAVFAGDIESMLQATRDAAVRVRYVLQYDGDEAPQGESFRYRCPNCGNTHSRSLSEYVRLERNPTEAGYLIDGMTVVTKDPGIHPRFIERIEVERNATSIAAAPHALLLDQGGMTLRLDEAFDVASPLQFEGANAPYTVVSYGEANGRWLAVAEPLRVTTTQSDEGEMWESPSSTGVVFGAGGRPATVMLDEGVAAGADWMTPPAEWRTLEWGRREALLERLENQWASGLVHVVVNLRSPDASPEAMMRQQFSSFGGDTDLSSATRWDGLGCILDDGRLLVLADFPSAVTARIERVRATLPDGVEAEAKFEGSLKEFGAFLARLNEPIDLSVRFSESDAIAHRDELVLVASLRIEGEQRVSVYDHFRMSSFTRGWKDRIYPSIDPTDDHDFIFDNEGRLIALPLQRRARGDRNDYYARWSDDMTVSASTAIDAMADIDDQNRPLSEEEANRIAWLGVDLQRLDPELARYHGVSGHTQDGATGAVVTHVYPESPAANAGLQVGDVLLRIFTEERRQPIDIVVDYESMSMFGGGFPWDQLDQVPEAFYEQIPPPWPSVETSLTRTLTDLGSGTSFRLSFARDGEAREVKMVVEIGPPHYRAASKHVFEELGLTLREMTYEVRRYFQMEDDEPGLIVAKVEPGGRASIGGIKPYEIITSIDGEPVQSVDDAMEAAPDSGEIRLDVKRMGKGRVVKIRID